MNPKQYKQFLKQHLTKNPKRSVFVRGKVGVGKSQTTKQVADELGYDFVDVRLSLLDAIDLRGLPKIEGRETVWTRPTFLPPENYKGKMILFLDEFNTANNSIQNSSLQLVLDRTIGEYHLPDGVSIVCAGNTLHDGAHVFKMSSALTNRFINLNFEVGFDEWKEHALKEDVNHLVVSFLNFRPELLHNFKTDMRGDAFASPRTWFFVNELMNEGHDDDTFLEALKGCVGEGAGVEFYGFLRIYKDLPKPETILVDGKDVVPKEHSQLFALTGALISFINKHPERIERFLEYSFKLPQEFSVLMIKDARRTKIDDQLMTSPKMKKWLEKHKEVIL